MVFNVGDTFNSLISNHIGNSFNKSCLINLIWKFTNNNLKSADEGQAAFSMAIRNGKIGLTHLKLNRLANDGTTGGLPLEGSDTTILMEPSKWGGGGAPRPVSPWSAELSPDGKKLYGKKRI